MSCQDPFSQGWALRLTPAKWKSPAGGGGTGVRRLAVVAGARCLLWIYLAGRGKDTVVPHGELGLARISGNGQIVDLLTSLLPVTSVNTSCTSALRAERVFPGEGRSPQPELNPALQEDKRWHLPVPARPRSSWAFSAQILWILVIRPQPGLYPFF